MHTELVLPPSPRAETGADHVEASAKASLSIAFIGARGVWGTYSGIETYYEELGSRLAAKGHSVTAYCRNYFTPPLESYRGINVRRLPSVNTKHLETITHSTIATLDCLFRDFDIVQYHALGSAPLSFLPRLFGKRTVVSVRGLDWRRSKWHWTARSVLQAGEWASSRFPTATAVVSSTLADYYRNQHGAETTCIKNAVDRIDAVPIDRLEAMDIKSRGFLLFAGRLSPEKQIHVLIEAARPLLGDIKLLIAGDSSHTDEYAQQLKRTAGDNVIFLGSVDRAFMSELYSHALAFVLPSTMEGLSLSLLEALSYGNTIVTSDIPENREVVGDAGLFFPVGDVSALREALEKIVKRPDLAQELREAAARRADAQSDWDAVANQTESFYFDLVSNSPSQGR